MQDHKVRIPGSLLADIIRYSDIDEPGKNRALKVLKLFGAAGQEDIDPVSIVNAMAIMGHHDVAREVLRQVGHMENEYKMPRAPTSAGHRYGKLTVAGDIAFPGNVTIEDGVITGNLYVPDGVLTYGRLQVGGEVKALDLEPMFGGSITKFEAGFPGDAATEGSEVDMPEAAAPAKTRVKGPGF